MNEKERALENVLAAARLVKDDPSRAETEIIKAVEEFDRLPPEKSLAKRKAVLWDKIKSLLVVWVGFLVDLLPEPETSRPEQISMTLPYKRRVTIKWDDDPFWQDPPPM